MVVVLMSHPLLGLLASQKNQNDHVDIFIDLKDEDELMVGNNSDDHSELLKLLESFTNFNLTSDDINIHSLPMPTAETEQDITIGSATPPLFSTPPLNIPPLPHDPINNNYSFPQTPVRRRRNSGLRPPKAVKQHRHVASSTTMHMLDDIYYLPGPSDTCHMCLTEMISELSCTHLNDGCFHLTKVTEEDHRLLVAGRGGEGIVLHATLEHPLDPSGSCRQVALKALHYNRHAYEINQEKLLDEMLKLLFLSTSESILHCYGHTILPTPLPTIDGNLHFSPVIFSPLRGMTPFVVMELAPYGDLHSLLHFMTQDNTAVGIENKPLPLSVLIQCMLDITKGIRDMHMFSLKHRDIKPKNILVFQNLKVKLSDFGLTKYHTDSQVEYSNGTDDIDDDMLEHIQGNSELSMTSAHTDGESLDSLVLTTSAVGTDGDHTTCVTSTIVGTHGYVAPDRVQTMASDIFSLGITFIHIVNHRYNTSQGWKEQARHAKNKLISFDSWKEEPVEIRESLGGLIEQMIDTDPTRRPTAESLVKELSKLLNSCRIDPSIVEDIEKDIQLLLKRNSNNR